MANRKFYNTGRTKLGAILGDYTEIGCNSVTSPGTIVEPKSIIYSGIPVPAGYYPKGTYITPSKKSGGGQLINDPLVDTGQMLDSVSYRVKNNAN